ncbi:MAG: hypothetical protein NC429_13130 [Lachnospiraceae bacterium]|nr:hypothetical protein [Lachnospiraceae bacterium]
MIYCTVERNLQDMEKENLHRQELLDKYRRIMGNLFRYLPWLEEKSGKKMVHSYQGSDMPQASMTIPVYDSTLLSFVKEMNATGLMNRNYVYVFSRNGIHTEQDELQMIDRSELKDIENIFGIMAKYVLGGMTKGVLWSRAIENGVFYHGLKRIKELLDVWDEPLA